MTWHAFYLVCFALGLSLTVLSALGVFAHLHFGHFHLHAPTGHAGHGHVHVPHANGGAQAAGKASVSPVNGFTLAAFLCWFGGCGYLLTEFGDFVMPVVLGIATLTGLAGSSILFWFLARVLMPHERELTAADTEILGMLGRVSGAIREGGTGEILFSQNGSRRFAHARSEEGVAIPRDTEVVVMRYEQGIAYVRRWDDVAADEADDPQPGTTLNQ
jgi:membrane protein implicated in regulation of membrane protease activity